MKLTASGTTTLVLTATAPDNFINVTSVGTGTSTAAVTTAGVARVGYGADLIAAGVPVATATNYYTCYTLTYAAIDPKHTTGENASQVFVANVYVNNGSSSTLAGSASTFDTGLTTLLQAVATAAASIEGVAVAS